MPNLQNIFSVRRVLLLLSILPRPLKLLYTAQHSAEIRESAKLNWQAVMRLSHKIESDINYDH